MDIDHIDMQPRTMSPSGYPLACLFQITTGASLFFCCFNFSPALAIILTLIITPVLVRTTLVLDRLRRSGTLISIFIRIKVFLTSLVDVLVLLAIGALVFTAISIAFGFGGWLFSLMVNSTALGKEAVFLGVVAGMVWGVFGGFVVVLSLAIRTWGAAEQKLA